MNPPVDGYYVNAPGDAAVRWDGWTDVTVEEGRDWLAW
jgi:hypothetical protein